MIKNKRNKKLLIATLVAYTFSLSSCGEPSGGEIINPPDNKVTWKHFAKREATPTQVGIREYWINSDGEYQFSAPLSDNITNSYRYDTSDFAENDPRYIFYLNDDIEVFYSEINSKYVFDDASILEGYRTKNIPETKGEPTRVEFFKNNNLPYYSCNITLVSDVINSNISLENLQNRIEKNNDSGFYVFTKDLNNPSTSVSDEISLLSGTFKGIIDGRNHTISSPNFEKNRMLGNLNGAIIKNLNFTNVSTFPILGDNIINSTLDNVNFEASDSIDKSSKSGIICNTISGKTVIKNSKIDYKDNFVISTSLGKALPVIANKNDTDIDHEIFQHIEIRCLDNVNLFSSDTHSRSLRPENGVNYVPVHFFIKDGVLNYDIKYQRNNSYIEKASVLLKTKIDEILEKTILVSSFGPFDTFGPETSSIIIGSNDSLLNIGEQLPSKSGDYQIKTVGKAIYINAYNDTAYQTAILEFLSKLFKYNYYAKDFYSYEIKDKNNIGLLDVDIKGNSPFEYRRCNWGDIGNFDVYESGYSTIAFGSDDCFLTVPALPVSDSFYSMANKFHTILYFAYPDYYLSSHPKWYATDSYGRNYAKYNNSYLNWQLCFSCHGDQSEYNNLLEIMSNNIVNVFNNLIDKSNKLLSLSISDSDVYCHCSSCNALVKQYGSISGTMIKFTNDMKHILDAKLGEGVINLVTMAYMGYRKAPIINGNPTILSEVPVMLAPIQANFTHPLNDLTYNQESFNLFEDWCSISEVYTWLYETNFSHYLFPYNSFEAMGETLKFIASKNIKMAYIQGQHNLKDQRRTGFNDLKIYLNGKFENNLNSNYSELVDAFFRNYYGKGYQKIRQFFDEMVDKMETFDTNYNYRYILYAGGSKNSLYADIEKASLWDKSQLESWVDLCEEAINLTSNEAIKLNILTESIFPRYALCQLFASQYDTSTLRSMRQSFLDDAKKLNIERLNEGGQITLTSLTSSWGM